MDSLGMEKMLLVVRALGIKPMLLEADPTDTIENLKMRIRYESKLPMQDMLLLYSGKLLEDSRNLNDYNISDMATLQLKFLLKKADLKRL